MKDFILQIPEWEGKLIFSGELVSLLMVLTMTVSGVLLCFWGYRYFKVLILIVFGCLSGTVGAQSGAGMTENLIAQMYIFVMFSFLGVCLFYLISICWTMLCKNLCRWSMLQKGSCVVSSALGAAVAGMAVYLKIYHNLIAVMIGTILLFLAGICHGYCSDRKERRFYTYEDLLRIEPLWEEKKDD